LVGGSPALADLDRDGDLDLVYDAALYLNDGNAGFTPSGALDVDGVSEVAVGDLDGDGDLDIATAVYEGLSRIHWNDGLGGFPSSVEFGSAGEQVLAIALGDLDGDGDLDVVLGEDNLASDRVYFNDGSGGFPSTGVAIDAGLESNDLALGDLDGDGDLDLVVVSTSDGLRLYRNDGSGGFLPAITDR